MGRKLLKLTLAVVFFCYFSAWSLGSEGADILFAMTVSFLALLEWSILREAKRLECRWYHVILFAGDKRAIQQTTQEIALQRAS